MYLKVQTQTPSRRFGVARPTGMSITRHAFQSKPVGRVGSFLSGETTEKTGFLSFSQASIVGDISFLLLCGVGVMLLWPSLPTLGQKIKGLIGGNQAS